MSQPAKHGQPFYRDKKSIYKKKINFDLKKIADRQSKKSQKVIKKFGLHFSFEMKKLLNNSSWHFEHVLDTIDDYWVDQDENFCPESTPTRWRCNHFPKKWSKSKFDATLSIKKPFVTPKFCGRNFSQMHHFEDMNFLSPLDFLYLL